MKIYFPDYNNSIIGITNSFMKYYEISHEYKSDAYLDKILSKHYKNVVFMIFDGLGDCMLKKNLSLFSFLRCHKRKVLSSVFPPTTAAATTSYYSGIPPVAHGWLGWAPYFKDQNKVIEIFTNREFYSQQQLDCPPVASKLQYEHILQKIQNKRKDIDASEIFPSFIKENGAKDLNDLALKIKEKLTQKKEQFVLCYWASPDDISHEKGPYSTEVKNNIKQINVYLKQLTSTTKDTLFIISADHGQVPISDAVYLDEYDDLYDCLAAPLALNDRSVSVHLKKSKEKTFKALFEEKFSNDFLLLSLDEVRTQHLFGFGKEHPCFSDFIGDFIIVSKGYKSIRCRYNGIYPEENLKGEHSGITKEEMLVPLIVIKT